MIGKMTTWPIADVVHQAPGITTLTVVGPPPALPGQFFLVWLPGMDEKPISVSRTDGHSTSLTICGVGPWSRAATALGVGDRIGLRGPFGSGFTTRGQSLIVGGGMGIAPLFFLAQRLMEEGHSFDMALGARTAQRLLFADEFARWGAHFATNDGSLGRTGTVLGEVRELLDLRSYQCVYACGPEAMLVALKGLTDERQIPVQFALERYMKCGIGLCGQCCMDGSGIRICIEGPVLSNDQLATVTDFGLPHRGADSRR